MSTDSKNFSVLLTLLASVILTAQTFTLKVLDAETNKHIPKARIIAHGEAFYTNDDGLALLPETIGSYEVSAPGFQRQQVQGKKEVIRLQPAYSEIEAIQITPIDFRSELEYIGRKYKKLYFSKPAVYDIVFKEKNIEDSLLYLLVVAEGELWTKSNTYNRKVGVHFIDKSLQLGFKKFNYLQFIESKKEAVEKKLFSNKSRWANLLFYHELQNLISFINLKDTQFTTRLLSQDEEVQHIGFRAVSKRNVILQGTFTYHRKDRVITHYQMEYDQASIPAYTFTDTDETEHTVKRGNGKKAFEFYKKDGAYYPTFAAWQADAAITTDDRTHQYILMREVIFKKARETRKPVLENKADLNISLWNNVASAAQSSDDILLSEEEQIFINKPYEN